MKRPLIYIAIFLAISFAGLSVSSASQDAALRGTSSSLAHLQLQGTLFTNSPAPVAIIKDIRDGKINTYEMGDMIGGAFKIIQIQRGEVTFDALTGQHKLSFTEGGVWQPQALKAEGDSWYNIQRNGDTFLVDEKTIKNALFRARDIARNVKVKPCFIDGKRSGVMVTELKPVGILNVIGLEKGDAIKSMNGLSLNTPYQMFRAYRKLQGQGEVKVDIVRGSKPLVLTYKVKK